MAKCKICGNGKTRFFCNVNTFSYHRCDRCRTLFLNPLPKKNDLILYYKKNFDFKAGLANQSRIRSKAKSILKALKGMHSQGTSLLDVGSGYGLLLDEAKKMGLSVEGIEPARRLSRQLRIQKNIKVIGTDFENYYLYHRRKKFDFIIMSHVLEHAANPKLWLKLASLLLNKNGLLYIETPNLGSHLFQAEKYNYTFLTPPDHLWIFSQQSVDKLIFSISNLFLEKSSTYSYPEHFMGILKSYINSQRHRLSSSTLTDYEQNSSIKKRLKYLIFDQAFAKLFFRFLNIGGYGSILELYIRKI